MDQLAQILTQTWMVYVFVAIIVLIALRPLYQSIVSIGLVNADLDKAAQMIRALGRDQQRDKFYAQFREINLHILRIAGLRHAWREFVGSMYFGNAAAKRVYLSHRPSHYFNRDSVLGTRISLSQFLAYPNYLIGLGLTFTFIGLAAALHVAQVGLMSGAGQAALKDLLAVASIKFISSIVGISSSLLISAIQRARIRQFQEKLSAFCNLLEECTQYKSTEKLLHDSFQEQQKQTAILDNMAPAIAGGIGEALSAGVSQALNPLSQELRLLAERFTGNCEEALKKVLEEFLSQLRQSTLDDMRELTENARILKASLDDMAANMKSAGNDFNSATQEAAARLAGILEQFVVAFAPVQQGIGHFGQTIASLETMTQHVQHAGNSIAAAAEDNKTSASEFGKTVTELSTGLVPMKAAMQEAQTRIERDREELHAILLSFQKLTDALPQLWKQYEERSDNVMHSLNGVRRGLARARGLKRESGRFLKLASRWRK